MPQEGCSALVDVGGNIATLVRRYDRPGPRYTSYPTALEFHPGFGDVAYRERLDLAAIARDEPLSLYVHLPFCEERCAYCGCTVVATRRREVASKYLEYVAREVRLLAGHLTNRRRLAQLHWGGGTPTYFSTAELQWLHDSISRHFILQPDAECAVEIDPRVTSPEQLRALRRMGFNRLSMGVQDFTAEVQAAIGRRQTENQTRGLFDYARQVGFDSINVDLIYGLPRQALASFTRTIASIVQMRPDRIAVYSYAHVPWLRPSQKRIKIEDLPAPAQKIELIGAAADGFLRAGYEAIGMDHFALPSDDLAVAARAGRLHRNFMGYTTRHAADVVAVGISAISDVRGAFAQNVKKLPAYYAALDQGRLPIARGYLLNSDDLIRRQVITDLMCNFRIDGADTERRFGVQLDTYFAAELRRLRAPGGPVADGLLDITGSGLAVTPRGRLFVRSICMHFDKYLPAALAQPAFSRTI